MSKIVFLDAYTLNPGDLDWGPIKALGELATYPRTEADQVLARAKDADILIVNKVVLNQEIIAGLPTLKCICVAATGYNNIDVEAASSADVVVCNVVGYGRQSVSQHVFALLLEITNRVGQHSRSVAEGKWAEAKDWCYWEHPILELSGKVFGIYGLGSIGRQVAHIAQAFEMEVIAVHSHPARDKMEGVTFVNAEELYSKSDIISLHVPLTAETKYMINAGSLAQMKSSAILINTGRGDLIDEGDLRHALLENEIAAAALDVLSAEPPPADHPLTGLDNCIVTPHQAWASQSSRQRLLDTIVENIQAFLNGSPVNVVG